MINRFAVFANRAKNPEPITIEAPIGFAHGLRTSVPPSMLLPTELAECINFQINRGGQLQTRPGMHKLNTTALGKIISLASCKIDDTVYRFAQDDDYIIYSIDSEGVATEIGTAEGEANIIGYGDYAMVADGGYLKYIDDTETLKLAWDDGDGYDATFFNNLDDDVDGQLNYTAAKTDQVTFTTPSWPSGYTIALTRIEVKIAKAGTGAVPTFTVYRSSDDEVMASGEVTVSLAPDPGDYVDVSLTSVIPLSPETEYYIRMATPAYNGTNYVIWYTTDSVPVCAVSPGLPPKASNLLVHDRRLWAYGDSDNLGTLYFNNFAPFDWSTPSQAGYITTIDSNKTSYPIGAVISYFGVLYVYGTEEWPYLLKLGEDSTFFLTDLKQPLWTTPKKLTNIINDIWSLNSGGVSSISGVNLYGDIRTFSESFAIDDQIEYHWSDEAFVGYYKDRGQFWVVVGGRIFVAHTKAKALVNNMEVTRVRYPWSEYTFGFVPSCCGQWGDLVVGTEDGFIYTPDGSYTKDNAETTFYASMRSKYFQSPFRKLDILEAKILIDSDTGTNFDIVAYKDGSTITEVYRWEMSSALHDDTTIDDLGDVSIDALNVAISPVATPLVQKLGFICFAYQIQIDNLTVLGSEAHLDGLVIRYRMMED
jgi:hypothetical protein